MKKRKGQNEIMTGDSIYITQLQLINNDLLSIIIAFLVCWIES